MRWHPKGYGGKRRPAEMVRRDGWRDHGVFVVAVDDPRLTWPERELVRQLGERLYGRRIIAERTHTLNAINAGIAKRESVTIDGAVAEGKRQAEKIVAEARRQAEAITSNMNKRRDAINKEVEAREGALAALNAKIDAAKAEVRRVLTAA